MNKTGINIGHLKIHLRGSSSQAARGLTASLGSEIMGQLAGQKLPSGKINHVDAGQLAAGTATADELRRAIARQIALAVAAQTGNRVE